MQMDKVQRFLDLGEKVKGLEGEIKTAKEEMNQLEQSILEDFSASGVQNLRVNGHTVYLHRKLVARAKDGNRKALCDALMQCGLEDFVNKEPAYNTMSVEAWVREQQNQNQPIPQPLLDVLEINELYFVRSRKA